MEFNARKCHSHPAEEKVFIDWIQEQSQRGYPLTHCVLEERANTILRVRKGPDFAVGGMWVSRFLDTHKDKIGVYWAWALDHTGGNSLNLTAVGYYFDALEKLNRENDISAGNWYAVDEMGLALGLVDKIQVIGEAGKKVQHKLQDGNRKIVTVLKTICADDTSLCPTVVFKGQRLLKKSLPRVLILDGHASHCTLAFLDLAISYNIFVVSYPPHTTHRLQGLDVVIFTVLKHHWFMLRDLREQRSGLPVKKEDFLEILAPAQTTTLTSALILKAFCKTSAYPIDQTVISAEEMAPSQETTNQVVFLVSPVKAEQSLQPIVSQSPQGQELRRRWLIERMRRERRRTRSLTDSSILRPSHRSSGQRQ